VGYAHELVLHALMRRDALEEEAAAAASSVDLKGPVLAQLVENSGARAKGSEKVTNLSASGVAPVVGPRGTREAHEVGSNR